MRGARMRYLAYDAASDLSREESTETGMGGLKTHILHRALYMCIQVSPSKQVLVYVFLKREAKWAMQVYIMIVHRLKEGRVHGGGGTPSWRIKRYAHQVLRRLKGW